MSLEQLMDGAICTSVLVKASADEIATFLASSSELRGNDPRVLIAEMNEIGWCRVELTEEVERSGRMIDSDPLLREALSAMSDVAIEGPFGGDTPVRTARQISRAMGVAAVGIWASDQGPGIGGAVRFDRGERSWCFSAAGPEEIEMIDRVRGIEDADDELSEDLDAAFEALGEREEERSWSVSGWVTGHVASHVDKALADFGFDPEWIVDPVWSLAGMPEAPPEISRILPVA
jgi:hypothetical protein